MDFPGLWQHFTIPAEALEKQVFEEGLGFDGSSIRGWQAINESDMLVLPVADTAFLDPFCKDKTLTLLCNIQDPLTKEDYTRDPQCRPQGRQLHEVDRHRGYGLISDLNWSFFSSTRCARSDGHTPPITMSIASKALEHR